MFEASYCNKSAFVGSYSTLLCGYAALMSWFVTGDELLHLKGDGVESEVLDSELGSISFAGIRCCIDFLGC